MRPAIALRIRRLSAVAGFLLGLLLGACSSLDGKGDDAPAAPPDAIDRADRADRADRPRPEGGIGGTGAPSGRDLTGLFGTVTGFSSIEVNGRRVALPETLEAAARRLDIGATVLLESRLSEAGLEAVRVEPFHPLVGRIERIAAAEAELVVLGVPVMLDRDVRLAAAGEGASGDEARGRRDAVAALEPGDRVALHGLWRDGGLLATRIERRPPADPQGEAASALRGLLVPAEDGPPRIAGTPLDLACCDGPEAPVPEAPVYAEAEGRFEEGVLVVERLATGRELLFSDGVGRLVIEGFLAPNPADPGFHLAGFGILLDPGSPRPVAPGARAIFEGVLDGTFRIHSARPRP